MFPNNKGRHPGVGRGPVNWNSIIWIPAFAGMTIILSFCLPAFSQEPVKSLAADYKEIAYYLNKLETTELEDERVKYNKILHEAIVNNDLGDKKIIKAMKPLIERVVRAQDSGLDRMSITGQSFWLQSAIDYFNQEKGRKVVEVPQGKWRISQTESADGKSISVFPDRIILLQKKKSDTIVEMEHIHEAVISQDGEKVAFFRVPSQETSDAEIWVVNLKKNKVKMVAQVPSCYSLVLSQNGKRLFFQAQKEVGSVSSGLFSVSTRGGGVRSLGLVAKLMTIVVEGDYEDNLVVLKNRPHHLGVARKDCAYIVTPHGKELGRVKDFPCE